MVDEIEQSAPVDAAPAPEVQAPVEVPVAPEIPVEPAPEPVAPDQAAVPPVETAPSSEPLPEVQAPEVVEPIVSEPTPTEPLIEHAADAQVQSSSSISAQQSIPALLPPSDLAQRGLAARRDRKEAKLQKILALVKKESLIGSIDVQKYLHVADSTATRYLKELVAQGKLKHTGLPSRTQYEIAP